MSKPTPGPWEYVASTEHHGPYVCGPYGGDVADCYTMSNPALPSVRNGGTSTPIPFMGEEADANARLIAAAPDGLEAAELAVEHMEWSTEHGRAAYDALKAFIVKARGEA